MQAWSTKVIRQIERVVEELVLLGIGDGHNVSIQADSASALECWKYDLHSHSKLSATSFPFKVNNNIAVVIEWERINWRVCNEL
jgi:hypothetical protein